MTTVHELRKRYEAETGNRCWKQPGPYELWLESLLLSLESKHAEQLKDAVLFGYRTHEDDPHESSEETVVADFFKTRAN